ncbi:MAG: TetR/AcrR family transcriptional regulator [Deltaproteobacteria bacterium]|nr:TetR/AcrR family transcriptional regulator [Deltaproteobacteria bacterium]
MKRISKEDTRRRIIDASVEVFAELGFFSARVSDVAQRAGVADGTIYLYFRSKDDLLLSLFREKMSEIVDRLHLIVSDPIPPDAKIRRYVAEHLALVEDQPKLMQILTVEIRKSARFLRASGTALGFARYLALVAQIIAEGQDVGIFAKSFDPHVVARALFGAIDEISLSWVLDKNRPDKNRPPRDRSEVAVQVSAFILSGLGFASSRSEPEPVEPAP